MSLRKCKNDPNKFCYICGEYIIRREQVNISPLIEGRFFDYLKYKLGDQDKLFAPRVICRRCNSNLSSWDNHKIKKLPFSTPMAWSEQLDHTTDCYFCCARVASINRRFRKSGFVKHGCFLWKWNRRDRKNHYTQASWTPREHATVAELNGKFEPLVS